MTLISRLKGSNIPRYRILSVPSAYWNARAQVSVRLFGRHLFWWTFYKSWYSYECELRIQSRAENGPKFVVSEVF